MADRVGGHLADQQSRSRATSRIGESSTRALTTNWRASST
jgi:hypothetical protein